MRLKWLQLLLLGGGTAENRERMVEGEVFSTCVHLFWMPEEHIIRTYHLPSHVIFYLVQEINFEPSTRSQAIPGLSKLLANLHFLSSGSFQRTVAFLFLYSLFATTLICAAHGRLHWSICKLDVVSVFFHLRVVSKSPAEISTPIGAVLELCSRANLPCLVKLASCVNGTFSKIPVNSFRKFTSMRCCNITSKLPVWARTSSERAHVRRLLPQSSGSRYINHISTT